MARFRLSAPAEAQIGDILAWSEDNFGERTRERYAALLVRAMHDIAENPRRASVVWKRFAVGLIGVYHLRHSSREDLSRSDRVQEPRHHLIFRIGDDDIVDILGFIHERMLFDRALRRLIAPVKRAR